MPIGPTPPTANSAITDLEPKKPKKKKESEKEEEVEKKKRKMKKAKGIHILNRQREKEYWLWHARSAHLYGLKRTIDLQAADDIPPSFNFLTTDPNPCISCLKGKQKKISFPLAICTKRKVGEVLHIDLQGPMEV